MRRYEHRPTPSQPTKSPSRLEESTRISIREHEQVQEREELRLARIVRHVASE